MAPPYLYSTDVIPGLPDDLRPIGQQFYDKATDATYDVAQAILSTLQNLGKAKGDPAALQTGETKIRVDVKTQVTQAITDLNAALDGFNRNGAWKGSGANAFFDYTPRLVSAMQTLEGNCTSTADAIASYRAGLMDLWQEVIKETSNAVGQTLGALADNDPKKRAATVVNIVNAWVGWAGNLWAAYVKIDEAGYQAMDKIGAVLNAHSGLVDVKGQDNEHYDGPVGYQLPMPTDVSLSVDWTDQQVKDHWQLDGSSSVGIEFEPFMTFVQALRDNGDHWNQAYKLQIQAWLAMPESAFSVVGGKFYAELSQALTQDYLTYLYSDERMDMLANLMDKVADAYGQTDAHHGQLIREYLANE
jgi:uncharacterized protein YukE